MEELGKKPENDLRVCMPGDRVHVLIQKNIWLLKNKIIMVN